MSRGSARIKQTSALGGQYHWISEFAPRSQQKVLSFVVGWLCTLGWQSGTAIGCFLAATEIQGLIVLNNDDYVYERWHGTLLTIAVVCFVACFNTFFSKHLPMIERLVLCLHVGGFICILVPLWVLGPRGNSHEIWTVFEDGGGWGSSMPPVKPPASPATSSLGGSKADKPFQCSRPCHARWFNYTRHRIPRRGCRCPYGRRIEECFENSAQSHGLDVNCQWKPGFHHAHVDNRRS